MPEFLRTLYICYLGKNMGIRMQAIITFIVKLESEWFFDQYSTSVDSIKDFLQRVKKANLELK
jgi:hypothetical protein